MNIPTHTWLVEEIKSNLLINNQIHGHNNTRINNQMSILRVNRSKTKHCVLHNGMITWNSVYLIQLKSTYPLQCSRARYEISIWKNIDAGRHYDCIFFCHACNCGFSSVTVFGIGYFAVKFPIISFVVIIRIIGDIIVN